MDAHAVLMGNLHLKEINPVQCGWQDCDPGHDYGPTVRDHYLLHYVLRGTGKFTAQGITHALRAGDLFVIHPQETTYYAADRSTPWSYIWIGFAAEIPLPDALSRSVLHMPQLQPVFQAIHIAEQMKSGREQYLCGLVWQILAYLESQEGGDRMTPRQAAEVARTFMDTEYANRISVGQLADRLHMDRSYFFRLFKEAVGCSPQQYLLQVRMSKAAELLGQYGYSPSAAAASVGYEDLSTFSRMFKRTYGVAPSRYNKQ